MKQGSDNFARRAVCAPKQWRVIAALKYRLLPTLLLLADISSGQACPVANKFIQITANGHTLATEIAATRTSHMCGLAFRHSLPADHGMLFAYAKDQIVAFWMKNTLIPLSIAFLDGDGRILETYDMDPHDPARRYTSSVPARYALEVNQGWFYDKDIEAGDRVEFDLQAGPEIFKSNAQ